jgi:hypothetical protein
MLISMTRKEGKALTFKNVKTLTRVKSYDKTHRLSTVASALKRRQTKVYTMWHCGDQGRGRGQLLPDNLGFSWFNLRAVV